MDVSGQNIVQLLSSRGFILRHIGQSLRRLIYGGLFQSVTLHTLFPRGSALLRICGSLSQCINVCVGVITLDNVNSAERTSSTSLSVLPSEFVRGDFSHVQPRLGRLHLARAHHTVAEDVVEFEADHHPGGVHMICPLRRSTLQAGMRQLERRGSHVI